MKDISTLNDAKHGTVVYSSYQTEGRGRGTGRSWLSSKGKNLLFTILLDPQKIAHPHLRIPLICGLALTDYLKINYSLPSQLKWPNDVLINEKKIAGILCEYKSGKILAGMGINCLENTFPPEIAWKSTSLIQEINELNLNIPEILESFLNTLKARLELENWKADALTVLYGLNKTVAVNLGSAENEVKTERIIHGLDDNGFLLVKSHPDSKIETIAVGEIQFQKFTNPDIPG